jgi:hypothetical protein
MDFKSTITLIGHDVVSLAHHIEVFDILRLQFDRKAFERDDFHECLTLPLPFDRDVATIRRLLLQGILAGDFPPNGPTKWYEI